MNRKLLIVLALFLPLGALGCPAASKNYAEPFLLPRPSSLLEDCALGKLIDFGSIKLVDPTASLMKLIKGEVCGVIRDISNPFVDGLNDGITNYNENITGVSGTWNDALTPGSSKQKYSPPSSYTPAPGPNPKGSWMTPAQQQVTPQRKASPHNPSGSPTSQRLIDKDANRQLNPSNPARNWNEIYQGLVR